MHNLTLTKLACGHGLDIQPLIQNLVDPSEQAYKQATKQPKMCMQLISTCMQWIFQSCIFLEAHFNRHTFNLQQTLVGSLPRSCVLLLQFPLGSTRRCQLWCWKTSRRWVSVQKQWVWWLLHSLLLMAVQSYTIQVSVCCTMVYKGMIVILVLAFGPAPVIWHIVAPFPGLKRRRKGLLSAVRACA